MQENEEKQVKRCPFMSGVIPVPRQGIQVSGEMQVAILHSCGECIRENCQFWDEDCMISKACKKIMEDQMDLFERAEEIAQKAMKIYPVIMKHIEHHFEEERKKNPIIQYNKARHEIEKDIFREMGLDPKNAMSPEIFKEWQIRVNEKFSEWEEENIPEDQRIQERIDQSKMTSYIKAYTE